MTAPVTESEASAAAETRRRRRIVLGLGLAALALLLVSLVSRELALRHAPPPSYGPMPSFSLTDEQGRPFGHERLAGHVSVVNFVFTRCPTVCPTLTSEMASLQRATAQHGDRVRLVTFSVDPAHDTPEVLREFGAKFGQDPARWSFVTGDVAAVKAAVEQGFHIAMEGADRPDATPYDVVHGEHFVLLDADGRIRGYYPVNEEGLDRLLGHLDRLLDP